MDVELLESNAARSDLVTVTIKTPLGEMRCTASERGIRSLEFIDDDASHWSDSGMHPHLEALRAELARYFRGELREFSVPLDPHGTHFRERVWTELRRIPYGSTISYLELARRIGHPGASRAVGGANGANPICIVIPCHRVVAADGSLGGYSAGLRRKERLLALELTGKLPR
jgi:O-6-methylguanine DNA methyltransferase